MTVSASFDFSKISAKLDEIVVAAKEGTRTAAQAGAQVFYDEMRARVPVSDNAHFFYGRNSRKTGVRYYFEPGNLKNSIYQYRLRYYDDGGKTTYVISWNKLKAPYGHMVEFGTSRAPAHPFLRPTYDAAQGTAVKTVKEVMAQQIKKVIR